MKLRILPLIASFALLAGCAGDFQSGSSEPAASVDTSSIDTFNETQQRINDQMAVDAANAAATEQNNAANAATQQFENYMNAQFNQNGLQ
jgi:hypothetical protein